MKKALREIHQLLNTRVKTFIQKIDSEYEHDFEKHKSHVIIASNLILSVISTTLLVIQVIQSFQPNITSAPVVDIVVDIVTIVVGLSGIYFVKEKRINIASYLILGYLFLYALLSLYIGPHPIFNVPSIFTLLLFAVLMMILLEPHQAWIGFGLITISLFTVNILRLEDIGAGQISRDPEGEAIFSLLTWLVGGGLITLIIFSTTRVLKNQARKLRKQLQAIQDKEEKIEASEKRYRNIFEGVQDAVLVETDQGDILDVNNRACEMFGYTYDEFLNLKVSDIVSDQGTMIDTDFLKERGGFVENIESENINAAGENFPVEFSAQLQHINEKEVMVIVSRDISERKAAEDALKRKVKELQALHRIADAGTEEIDEDKIIDTATAVIGRLLNPEFHGVLILNEEKTHLSVHPSYRNVPDQYRNASIPVEKGISGEVARTGEARYYPDVREVPHFLNIIPDVRCELCLPIKTQNEILGVINVESSEIDAYDEGDQRLLQTLASQLATSIERARLFNTVNRQLGRLQSLRTIDRAITGSLDLNVTLNIILNQATSQLDVDAACVLLLNQESQTLHYRKGKGFRTNAIRNIYQRIGSGLGGKVAMGDDLVHVPNIKEITISRDRVTLTKEEGFEFYCGLPLISKGKPQGILELYHRSPKPISQEWIDYAKLLSGQAAIAIDNARLFEELQKVNLNLSQAYDSTLEGWATALELRDHDTQGHSQRVTELTLKLADELGVPEEDLPHIKRGALLHDIGKMAIPDEILQKEGELTDREWEIIKQHPLHAREMLQPIRYLRKALDIPLYHHEWWDGNGYPDGLQGEQIPLPARIFAVVDVWDALTSDRPYRKAWSQDEAYQYIIEHSGTQFDPTVVQAFLRVTGHERGIPAETPDVR